MDPEGNCLKCHPSGRGALLIPAWFPLHICGLTCSENWHVSLGAVFHHGPCSGHFYPCQTLSAIYLCSVCVINAKMNMYRFSDRLTGHAFLTLDEPSICSPLVKAEASGTSGSNASSHVSSKKNSVFCQLYSRMGSHIGSGYHAAAGTSSKLLPLCQWPVAMNQVLVSPVALSDVNHGEAFAEACRA